MCIIKRKEINSGNKKSLRIARNGKEAKKQGKRKQEDTKNEK